MYFDPAVSLAGLLVGFVIGLTGMGGGALMTPVLVLVFGVQPLAAVSSDLVASLVMKPFGSAVHMRRRTVDWGLVRWLALGAVPSAFAGVLVIRLLGRGTDVQHLVTVSLGVALLIAAVAMVARLLLDSAGARREAPEGPVAVRRLPTVLTGILGGLLVGMTSTGSGTVIIVCLTLIYPLLPLRRLVGTDLVQAVPLVGAAALGHLLFGDFQLGLTTSLLVGAIPGVLLGARLSSRAPDLLVRPALVFVLTGTALKLLGASTPTLGLTLLLLALVGLPAWALFDAGRQARSGWASAGVDRGRMLALQAVGLLLGLGPVVAAVYFARVRPRLRAAAEVRPPLAALEPVS
ncbi:sulfite exporter TauE/SafE family protein [Cryptosporangium sp. NPDC051539]|uniref:sulfite exporter TauE/SafE family protein n=1 Tax=Cryptosporangium sp. NPDC051539 TaxID=3363962 RepID=UPI00378794A8